MSDKIALITGASRGIGAALAKKLGTQGVQIVALARTVGGLEETDDAIRNAGGPPAILVPVDFSKADGEFDALGLHLYERFKKLDMFFACAATLGPLTPAHHLQPKDWNEVMAVNVTANQRLIRSLDPLLRQSQSARAVFLTCDQGSQPEAFWGAYGASKAALEQLVKSYALETASSTIKVDLYNPGPCATKLRAKAFPGEDKTLHPSPDQVAEKILARYASEA